MRTLAAACLLPIQLYTALVAPTPTAVTAVADSSLKGYDANGGAGRVVYEADIDGTIDLGLASFVERVIGEAKEGDLVILRVKTFGGRVDAAVRIRDALLDTKATTIVYIDHRAISAGALISLAADTIIMSPGSSIGAATPVQMDESGEAKPTSEKVVSYMRAEMRATAEAKGRRADIAEAMVDPDIAIPGVSDKGKLLTLTGDKARELGLAAALAETYEDVFSLLNIREAKRSQRQTHWGENLARMLTDPTVSSILMSIGMLGLFMEFYSGGHGIGAAVGLSCLGLFFFGQYAANLAGMEEILLFGVGVVLLAVEVFVLPGFGIAGILGIVCVALGFGLALVEFQLPMGVSYDLGYVQEAVNAVAKQLALVLVLSSLGAWLLVKYLPRTTLGGELILGESSVGGAHVDLPPETPQAAAANALVGQSGVAIGPLRPAGIAEIGGTRVDVVSEGGFVEAGAKVLVTEASALRVVVRAIT